ncbi:MULTISPECIES: SPOR domain-containing protein [unclassified Limnobacter]|uniref:SPOR domain-containing protein n=1 Tax=unclassified Limnobacter TaxID=2630203 RepID=UPI0025C3E92B|nr:MULTISPECIES: SPOR domain-containing protein [unclassified Limnobacter]
MSSNSRSTARNKVNNDPVDELKRRSRRRLVGSIALFLAAIIIVPALVENEPSQTSSDVELVVPDRPSAEIPAQAAQVPEQPKIEAPQSTQEQALATAPVAPAVEPPPVVSEPAPKPAPKPEPKPEPKAETKVEPKVEPKVEDPIAAFAKAEVYWVQVAAVSDKLRADALSKELSGKGFPAKVESTSTGNGTVYRVRVGPIAGQAKADETKAKLAAAGYSAGRVVQ